MHETRTTWAMKGLVYLFTLVACVQCLIISDSPCDISPDYVSGSIPDDPDYITNITLPQECRNGSLYWSYPVGHVMLYFTNQPDTSTAVCFRDSIGGDIFELTDRTEGAGDKPITTPVTREKWECSEASSAEELVIQVDAPSQVMYYMGAIDYLLQK